MITYIPFFFRLFTLADCSCLCGIVGSDSVHAAMTLSEKTDSISCLQSFFNVYINFMCISICSMLLLIISKTNFAVNFMLFFYNSHA